MSDEKEVLKKDSFPSNSYKAKTEPVKEEPKKVQKVVTGKVTQQKKPLGKKFVETFISDDVKNIKSYILHDVMIPAAKDTFSDIIQGVVGTIQDSIDLALFGETRRRSSSRSRSKSSYVSYNNYSSKDRDRRDRDRDKRDRDDRRNISDRGRSRHEFDEIVFETRADADEVRELLIELTESEYGEATVADLYDLVGISQEFTDRRYGWTNLKSSSISRTRDGYILNLPRPILLD